MMNRKKFIVVIFSIVVAFCLTACSTNNPKEYKAFEVSWGDGIVEAHHASEYEKWAPELQNRHSRKEAPKTATVVFNDVEYTADYYSSQITIPDLNERDLYRNDDVWFGIDSKTGELLQILFIGESQGTAMVSEKECGNIMDELAEKYINLDEFKVTEEKYDTESSYLLKRTYRRMIGKWNTSDCLVISVDGNGRVVSFGQITRNAFSKDEKVSFDEDKVYKVLDSKIKGIYDSNNYEYKIVTSTLIKPSKNTYGIVFDVEVNMEFNDSESNDIIKEGELLQILIEIS